MSLYQKYRPSTLEDIKGNNDILQALEGLLKDLTTCPHVFLFTGETGCGKTTLARIIANRLGCVGNDLREINSANFRGIDTIREIINNASFMPMEGVARGWILDECFAKDTIISLANGTQKQIQNINSGEKILNLTGIDEVINTFVNEVSLNRIVKITLSNNISIFCSEDHLFFTPKGWVPAKKLNDSFIFLNTFTNFMGDIKLLNTLNYGKRVPVLYLRSNLRSAKTFLFKVLCSFLYKNYQRRKQNTNSKVCDLWRRIYQEMVSNQNYLRTCLWECLSGTTSYWKNLDKRITFKKFQIPEAIIQYTRRISQSQTFFNSHENQQSICQSFNCTEGNGNETNKWNSTCLERQTRRQWNLYTTTNIISNELGLANGTSYFNRPTLSRQERISNKLQSRCRSSNFENSNRGQWQSSLFEKRESSRLEKEKQIERIRVESVVFYKRGNNDRYFESIIGDTERNQGFVKFYDLQVKNHPSYFANNVLIHNCHKITGDAANALLKILEDTPKHVYFILCTTDPQKLLATIKGRCSQFQVKPLNEIQMKALLRHVVREENETLAKEIYEQIVQDSLGHPRNALQILEQVLSVPEDKRLEIARQTAEEQSQVIELCRALLAKAGWKTIAKILTGLKDQEAESIRRVVLGYCQAVLLKEENYQAALILEEFITPFYDSGWPQLTYSCISVQMKGQ
jgi:DNA polymerase III gamma/tau subunit